MGWLKKTTGEYVLKADGTGKILLAGHVVSYLDDKTLSIIQYPVSISFDVKISLGETTLEIIQYPVSVSTVSIIGIISCPVQLNIPWIKQILFGRPQDNCTVEISISKCIIEINTPVSGFLIAQPEQILEVDSKWPT